jgi:deoxyribodipyrimidine photo-lyase
MQLIWFRTDLRVEDNTALLAAADNGLVVGLYIFTPEQWQTHDDAPNKIEFIRRHIATLSASLAALNIPLLIRTTGLWQDIPALMSDICREHDIADVHVNEEYGINEVVRDQAVAQTLKQSGIGFHSHQDKLLFTPGSILNQSGKYFQVFTQFKKNCYSRLYERLPLPDVTPPAQQSASIQSDPVPTSVAGIKSNPSIVDQWEIGEAAAQQQLARFAEKRMQQYHTTRDIPSLDATSHLSVYLTSGILSVRQCLHAAVVANSGNLAEGDNGIATWINELLWRDFYHHILVGYPRVSRHQPFKLATNKITWRDAPEDLLAWQQGKTGFPIIDAAMRQLLQTGWMHNRLRMVVAMFLTKNLLIDWRHGERWFMQHLIDGDLAANNGGWQWSASTGTDAVPYFRIFNPVSQSQRFDPEGVFIRKWIPELRSVNDKLIHDPHGAKDKRYAHLDYPQPIVDLSASRQRALDMFGSI